MRITNLAMHGVKETLRGSSFTVVPMDDYDVVKVKKEKERDQTLTMQ